MKHLRERVAAVTGAASGIGRALAVELAREGCHLALSDIDDEGLEATRKLAEPFGVRVTTRRLDVADKQDVFAWADEVVHDHGAVNLVFNNAGVALAARIRMMTLEECEWLMGINFWGVVYGTKAFLPHLEASGEGHVINISSVFGLIGFPANGPYNAAKFGVRGFTECLRIELDMEKLPVSATCVHPGGIKTNIARSARVGENEPGQDRAEADDAFDRLARTTPEQAARTILRGVKRNARRVLVGADAHAISWAQRLFPTGYQRVLARIAGRANWLV